MLDAYGPPLALYISSHCLYMSVREVFFAHMGLVHGPGYHMDLTGDYGAALQGV
jgi:hypothetical protein